MSPRTPAAARHDPVHGGFSLIELLVVAALIGVLSGIAIPAFLRYQMRSKAAEAGVNLSAIGVAEEIHFAEHGMYRSVAAAAPATIPGSSRATWPAGTDFELLGWVPEGQVYFQYLVTIGGVSGAHFTAEAASDLDADGNVRFWGYVKPPPGAAAGANGALPGTTCQGTGVYDHKTGALTRTGAPGACDAGSVHQVF